MQKLLYKLITNKKAVCSFLDRLPVSDIERGRLTLSPALLTDLLSSLRDDSWQVENVRFSDQGEIFFTLHTKSMALSYRLKPERLGMSQGRLAGSIAYQEERSGGGISNALLGMTGKSGLAFALSKYQGVAVTNKQIEINIVGLPKSLGFALTNVSAFGLSLRLY